MGTVFIFPPNNDTNNKRKRKRQKKSGYKLDDFIVADNGNDNVEEFLDEETSNESEDNIMEKLTDKEDSDADNDPIELPPPSPRRRSVKKGRYRLRDRQKLRPPKDIRDRISNIKERIQKISKNDDQDPDQDTENMKQAKKMLFDIVWKGAWDNVMGNDDEEDENYVFDTSLHNKLITNEAAYDKYLNTLLKNAEGEDDESEYQVVDNANKEESEEDKSKEAKKKAFEKYLEDEIFKDKSAKELEFEFYYKLTDEEKAVIKKTEQNVLDSYQSDVPLKFKILKTKLPLRVKAEILSKLKRFNEMDISHSEYHKLCNWIAGIDKMPFDRYVNLPVSNTSDIKDICQFLSKTAQTLDNCIYGQHEAKNKLMQVIAKWIKNNKSRGNVIGLKGPPGIGKTTLINHGLSKALNIPMRMISLGGSNDKSALTGHSYTWEGSTWGRIAGVLMETNCMNPIFFLDELDKVGESDKGHEIIGVLMHLIDYSQNHKFQDEYFSGIDLDLSRCIFVFSYNDEKKIDRILLDRITTIDMEGFEVKEKEKIAQNFLIKEITKSIGIDPTSVIIPNETIRYIIFNHSKAPGDTRIEKGVRKLKECLETIYLKINLHIFTHQDPDAIKQLKLSYQIPDFKLPITVTPLIAKELLYSKKKYEDWMNMFG